MKKVNSITSAIFVLLVLAVFSINAYALSGSGTEGDPWLIGSLSDFDDFVADTDYWDDYIRLDVDLDLSATTYTTSPIAPDTNSTSTGFQGTMFTGSFNGNSYTIANLTIDMGSIKGSYLGLFGYIDSAGEIKNLEVADCDIAGRSDADFIGGLAGFSKGTVEECAATGTLSGRDTIGGLIGYNSDGGNVNNCYGQVSVTGDDKLGGLIGGCYNSTVNDCYSTGVVSGDTDVGGLIGYNNGGTITACLWDVQTSLIFSSAGGTGKTTSEMQDESTFTDEGWDFVGEFINGVDYIWTIEPGNVDYPRYSMPGNGSQSSPFLIRSREDFDEFCENDFYWGFNLHAHLETDIDLAGTTYTEAVIAPGNFAFDQFFGKHYNGHFDGNGHIISNLTINALVSENHCLGLFGHTDGAVITNLGIENCDITGIYDSDGSCFAALIADNDNTTVSNCYSTGNVSSGGDRIGGLIGSNLESTITNSYSTCSVTDTTTDYTESLGGLCGTNFFSTITGCYATGSVTGESTTIHVGGLCGKNYNSTITDCHASGSVTGNFYIGGLCGDLGNECEITNCYSTGGVSGNSTIGGLVGSNDEDDSVINDCFWDTATSGQVTSAGGTGKTTLEMKIASTFLDAGWDFIESWDIEDNQTYPFLSLTYPTGDIDLDKDVDLVDFAIFASHWLEGVE